MHAVPACETCRLILGVFSDVNGSYDVDLGSVEDLTSSNCAGHSSVFQILIHDLEEEEGYSNAFRFRLVKKQHRSGIRLYLLNEELESNLQLELVGRKDVANHPGRGQILDRDWIDTDLLCQWKSFCLQNHGSACENPMGIDQVQPMWLIDTTSNCLVPGEGRGPYLTLSYRWGRSGELKALKGNIKKLQEHMVFSEAEFKKQIPTLIHNAMHLTRCLEQRYLWVDALCIVQDDDKSKGAEITRMAEIYASSIITIVAAEGDGDGSLYGLHGCTGSRELDQRVIAFVDGEMLLESTESDDTATFPFGATYFTRGWTFQEFFMSKRRLVFRDGGAHWECHSANFHEGLEHTGSARLPPVKTMLEHTLGGYPDMKEYFEVVGKYNARDLTYEQDALSAIWGLLSMLNRSFEDGFLQGLPEMFFDVALRWRSAHELERRKPTVVAGPPPYLPTWSWMGWKGQISSDNTFDADFIRNADTFCNRSQTFPITQWYTSDAIAGPWRRIKSKWFEYRQELETTKDLPPSWSRHLLTEPTHPDPSPCQGDGDSPPYYYTHPAVPSTQFWFPVPIFDAGTLTNKMPPQTRYISCKTQRTWLRAFPIPEDHILNEHGYPWLLRIRDQSGVLAGEIYLHFESDRELFNESKGSPLELVAISRGRELLDPMLRGYRELYHVLWVKWEQSVATRRAVGWVERCFWEAQDLEPISLILE
jgi:hypothetical protein